MRQPSDHLDCDMTRNRLLRTKEKIKTNGEYALDKQAIKEAIPR